MAAKHYNVTDVTDLDNKKIQKLFYRDYVFWEFIISPTKNSCVKKYKEHGKNKCYILTTDDWEQQTPDPQRYDLTSPDKNNGYGVINGDQFNNLDDFGISMIFVMVKGKGEKEIIATHRYKRHFWSWRSEIEYKDLVNILQQDPLELCPPAVINTEDSNNYIGNYTIHKISKFSDVRKFANINGYSSHWEFTKNKDNFADATGYDRYTIYVCTAPNYDTIINPHYGKDHDTWNKSMIAVLLDERGKFYAAIGRECGKFMRKTSAESNSYAFTAKEFTKLLNMPYTNVMESNNKVADVLENVNDRLRTNERIDNIFADLQGDVPRVNNIVPVAFKDFSIQLSQGGFKVFRYSLTNYLNVDTRELLYEDKGFTRCFPFTKVNLKDGSDFIYGEIFDKERYFLVDSGGNKITGQFTRISGCSPYGIFLVELNGYFNYMDTDGILISNDWLYSNYSPVFKSDIDFAFGPYARVFAADRNSFNHTDNIIDIDGNLLLPVIPNTIILRSANHIVFIKRPAQNFWANYYKEEYNYFNLETGEFLNDDWVIVEYKSYVNSGLPFQTQTIKGTNDPGPYQKLVAYYNPKTQSVELNGWMNMDGVIYDHTGKKI